MAKYYKNKYTGRVEKVQKGYNWWVAMIGSIYLIYKRQYAMGLGYGFVAIVLGYIGDIISYDWGFLLSPIPYIFAGFYFNELFEEYLIENDYERIDIKLEKKD